MKDANQMNAMFGIFYKLMFMLLSFVIVLMLRVCQRNRESHVHEANRISPRCPTFGTDIFLQQIRVHDTTETSGFADIIHCTL